MYNYPYDDLRPQHMNTMNMQTMGNQMPSSPNIQQPFFNQMPIMPMQPMLPMQQVQPMGTAVGITAGMPVPGTTSGPLPTTIASMPIGLEQQEPPIMDIEYTQGWLRTQIGQRVKIEFLIGTNMLIDREGTLLDVGISYVIINEVETDDLLLCDIYSIKFVRIYQ